MNAAERFTVAQRIKLVEQRRPRLVTEKFVEVVREKYPPNQPEMLCAHCRSAVPDRQPLTEKQAEVFAFIRDEIRARGVCPLHEEITQRFGFSSTGASWWHVNSLVKKGWLIRHAANKKQNLTLADGL